MRPDFPLRRTRIVNVIIATATLAAPASALALTTGSSPAGPSPGQPSKLHVGVRGARTGAPVVRAGVPVTVSGTAPAQDAAQTVVLQSQPAGSGAWAPIGQAQVAPGGAYRFRVALRASSVLRAAIGATTAQTAVSRVTPVTVAARFALHRHQYQVLGAGAVRVVGKLLPAATGRVVRLQAKTPAGWHTVAATHTGTHGGFSLRHGAGASAQRLRVRFPGDSLNAGATGAAGNVLVFSQALVSWYDDAGNTACGFHAGLGVANRTLPCGTKVSFRNGGRTVTATVDDRGPYVGGREYDLNQNTAAALGFAGVGPVWASAE